MKKLIHKNTFSAKEVIKSLGGKWNAEEKCWFVPDNVLNEALQACEKATQSTVSYSSSKNYPKKSFSGVRGCSDCRRLGRMCKQCRFDEYDC